MSELLGAVYLLVFPGLLFLLGFSFFAEWYDRKLVARLQSHYGQALDIGATLDAAFARSPWRVLDSRAVVLKIPAAHMAELHLANLRTWRGDEYASRSFDRVELDELEATLERIVARVEPASVVSNVIRQIVAEGAP